MPAPRSCATLEVHAMRHITRYRLLAIGIVGVLSTSITGRAQAPQARAPQATVRELATIEGDTNGFVRLPSGRTLIYRSVTDGGPVSSSRGGVSTFTYVIATKGRALLGTNM